MTTRTGEDFFAADDVFYGPVSRFKGLERTCFVLAVNGFSAQARAKQMLYVGLSLTGWVLQDGRWSDERRASADAVFRADLPFPVAVTPASLL